MKSPSFIVKLSVYVKSKAQVRAADGDGPVLPAATAPQASVVLPAARGRAVKCATKGETARVAMVHLQITVVRRVREVIGAVPKAGLLTAVVPRAVLMIAAVRVVPDSKDVVPVVRRATGVVPRVDLWTGVVRTARPPTVARKTVRNDPV